jgi:hypothetical protein
VLPGADRRGGDGCRDPRGHLGREPQPQPPAVGLLARAGLPQAGERGQGPARVGQQQRALVGEGDAPAAVEEADAQQCLQPAQPLGQGRLGDAHALRRGAEVLLLGQRDKDFQVSFGEQRTLPDVRGYADRIASTSRVYSTL